MIPKTIHLCWFSGSSYPLEVKVCLDTWRRHLPDYTVRVWTYDDARAIGIPYLDQALDLRRWAFAADVVRFYAVWKEGGIYMDSDIFLYRRFDEFIPKRGFATFCELPSCGHFGIQAAFFMGEAGNEFCKKMLDHYATHPYVLPDGTRDETISPTIMTRVAQTFGFVPEDREQHMGDLHIYPMRFLSPKKKHPRHPDAFGVHQAHNNWVKRKRGRRFELKIKRFLAGIRYFLFQR